MSYTLANSITWSEAFIGALTPTVFTGSEPAMSTANTIVSLILNPPFTWPWNRATATQAITNGGGQDYTVSNATFGFLEACFITDTNNNVIQLEDVFNNKALSLTSQPTRPNAVAVQSQVYGTSFSTRFSPLPDQDYTATFIFQKAPVFFTATTQDWLTQAGIPYSFIDVFNNLFLSEMLQFANDERAVQYRQRGMAALLSKASGLSEMQKNIILGQWMHDDLQTIAANLKTQQAAQVRTV
jgi:hypothetical protein